jgi:hypothetical protein
MIPLMHLSCTTMPSLLLPQVSKTELAPIDGPWWAFRDVCPRRMI